MKAFDKKSNDTAFDIPTEEDSLIIYQVLVVVLVQENPNNCLRRMDKIDLIRISSLLFEQCDIQIHRFKFNEKYISVDRNPGYTKGILLVEVDQGLNDQLLTNPVQRKIIKDIANDILKVVDFSFSDFQNIKQLQILENGKLAQNFIPFLPLQTNSDCVLNCQHKFDGQIYTINRIKLSQEPKWDDFYFNQLSELSEVMFLLKLNHPNILRIYSWWIESEPEENDNYYIYQQLEFYNQDLLQYIFQTLNHMKLNKKKQIIAQIFQQIVEGFQYINSQGIFHRDIKPQNILINQDYNGKIVIKISGFHIAKHNIDSDGNILGGFMQQELTGTEGYAGIRSFPNQIYDSTEEMYQIGMVLLDLCYLYERVADRIYYHLRVLTGNPPLDFEELFQDEFKLVKRLLKREFSNFSSLIESQEYQNLINQK